MALDHPERILALSVLDILPTAEHFERTDMAFAMGYFHWFLLAQPYDLPERLVGADPDAFYLRRPQAERERMARLAQTKQQTTPHN